MARRLQEMGVTVFALCGSIVLSGMIHAQECSTVEVLGYESPGYRYQIVSEMTPNFFREDFDDSGFSVGGAPFGSVDPRFSCALNTTSGIVTPWRVLGSQILVRKWIDFPPGTVEFRIHGAIDNDIQVWLNEVDISDGVDVHAGCASRDSFTFTAEGEFPEGPNLLAVRGIDRGDSGVTYLDVRAEVTWCPLPFRRADADADGRINVSDVIHILKIAFLGEESECEDAADVSNDARIDTSDAIGLLGYLFLGTLAPPPPFRECGRDLDDNELGCESYTPCN